VPRFNVRNLDDVPRPSLSVQATEERQRAYEDFILQADGKVGELALERGEVRRAVKVRLRRAASRVGRSLEIWDADGRVYFSAPAASGGKGAHLGAGGARSA
jgi:hypothetical protein